MVRKSILNMHGFFQKCIEVELDMFKKRSSSCLGICLQGEK